MRATASMAMILLLVSGCGGSKPAQPANGSSATAAGASNYQTRLQSMPEGERDAVFIRAIRDAGFTCQHVDSSTPAGGTAWVARCSDGGQWQIAIAANGQAQVTKVGNAAIPDTAGNAL